MKKIFMSIAMIMFILCACSATEKNSGMKKITVEVVADGTESFEIETEKDYLGDALKENNLIEGKDGQYGIFITSVNGIEADAENDEWWQLTKNGESVMTGADKTEISDGDCFEITLKKGF